MTAAGMEEIISLPKPKGKPNQDSRAKKRQRSKSKEGLRADGLDEKEAANQRTLKLEAAKEKYLRGGENKRREKRFKKERNRILRHKLVVYTRI